MSRTVLVVSSVALLALMASPAQTARVLEATTHDLQFRVVEQVLSAEQGYGVGGRATLRPAATDAERLSAEPKYASRRAYRGLVQLQREGDNQFALALDAANGQGPPYDRLYLDANNDEDLTNDPPVKPADVQTRDDGYIMTAFPPVTLDIPEQAGGPYAVAVTAYYVKQCPGCGEEHSGAGVSGACYWEGRARFGQQTRRVLLLDGDSNGLFNERNPSTLENVYGYGGDQIIVLPDADRATALDARLLQQAIPLGRYLQVGDAFWEIRPAATGASLRVYTRQVPTAAIRVNARGYRLLFVGEDGPVVVQADDGQTSLPLGKYRLREQAVIRTDRQGRRWMVETMPADGRLEALGATRVLASEPGILNVTPDSRLEIPAFGPPLVMSIGASPQEDQVLLSLSLAGENGDRVTGVLVDGERPPAPTFQIVSSAGKTIAQGQFEYG